MNKLLAILSIISLAAISYSVITRHQDKDATHWSYKEFKDETTGKSLYLARIVSIGRETRNCSGFRNDTASENSMPDVLNLTCMIKDGSEFVTLGTKNSAFAFNGESTTIKARFGNRGETEMAAVMASPSTMNIMFVCQPKEFISKIKDCDTLAITTLFEYGAAEFKFCTIGLEWPR